jgi:hypothetical protein
MKNKIIQGTKALQYLQISIYPDFVLPVGLFFYFCNPEGNLPELRFEDFEKNPVEEIKSIYEDLLKGLIAVA